MFKEKKLQSSLMFQNGDQSSSHAYSHKGGSRSNVPGGQRWGKCFFSGGHIVVKPENVILFYW